MKKRSGFPDAVENVSNRTSGFDLPHLTPHVHFRGLLSSLLPVHTRRVSSKSILIIWRVLALLRRCGVDGYVDGCVSCPRYRYAIAQSPGREYASTGFLPSPREAPYAVARITRCHSHNLRRTIGTGFLSTFSTYHQLLQCLRFIPVGDCTVAEKGVRQYKLLAGTLKEDTSR